MARTAGRAGGVVAVCCRGGGSGVGAPAGPSQPPASLALASIALPGMQIFDKYSLG